MHPKMAFLKMGFFHTCLQVKYPLFERILKGVWRGSTTGGQVDVVQNIYGNRRISLAFLGTIMPDLLDVGVVQHVQVPILL